MIAPEVETSPAPKAILIVEDEPLVRWLIADTLRESGYTVVEAGTADEALLYIKATDEVE